MVAQAEFFDVKVLSLGVTTIQNTQVVDHYTPIHLVDLIRLELAVNMGLYDANSVCWGEKVGHAFSCQLRSPCGADMRSWAEQTLMVWQDNAMSCSVSRAPQVCVALACALKLLVCVSGGRAC